MCAGRYLNDKLHFGTQTVYCSYYDLSRFPHYECEACV